MEDVSPFSEKIVDHLKHTTAAIVWNTKDFVQLFQDVVVTGQEEVQLNVAEVFQSSCNAFLEENTFSCLDRTEIGLVVVALVSQRVLLHPHTFER